MTKLVEMDLEFDFNDAIHVFQFDDDSYHGSSSCQRVDFIAEYEDCYRFIEVKDPDIPGAANVKGFQQKFKSGKLIQSLSGKYRDSLFFRTIQNKVDKKIQYIVLLSMQALDAPLLMSKQDELHRSIPFSHNDWQNNSAASCIVLNLQQWKRFFGENSVRRLSEETL